MRFRYACLVVMAVLCVSMPAYAIDMPPVVEKLVSPAQKVGVHSFSFLFFDVYDIALYAPGGVWRKDKPHALSLRYHMALDASDIIDRSMDEMRRQDMDPAKLVMWEKKLRSFFPDVEKGTVLAAVNIPNTKTVFYKDGKTIGVIHDPEFGGAYFGIWLSEQTSEPDMRAELLGDS